MTTAENKSTAGLTEPEMSQRDLSLSVVLGPAKGFKLKGQTFFNVKQMDNQKQMNFLV